jgi:hypothetical protein
VGAVERDEFRRAAWRVMVAQKVDPKCLVFVDEMGANTALSPIYAYSPRPKERGPTFAYLATARAEHDDAAFEHDHRGDGAIPGGRGRYHR